MVSTIGQVSELAERLTSPYWSEKEIPGDAFDGEFDMEMSRVSHNWKLLKSVDEGYWSQIRQNVDDFRDQMFPKNMTGGTLDRYARMFGLLRKKDESDAAFRIRIQGEIKKRIGGPEPENILQFVENFLNAEPGDVEIFENFTASGNREDAHFRVVFSTELLDSLGFEEPYTDEIEDIEKILDRVAGAGIQAEVTLISGSSWDTATYDSDDVYGT